MLYAKNVPGWERTARVIMGLAIIAMGLFYFQGARAGYVIAGAGVIALLTGFFGFCPMCALVGRKPDAQRGKE